MTKKKKSKTNYLVFDTETNGIGDFRPPTQTLTQLAFIQFERDGTILNSSCDVIKGATAVKDHPSVTISLERIKNEGIDDKVAIDKFLSCIDENTVLVCHNYEFDSSLINKLWSFEMKMLFSVVGLSCS